MILAVYSDDSADRGRENILTVGAFMGFPSMFIEAERKWVEVLKNRGVEYFKASECQARDGQFHPNRLMMDPRAAQTHAEIVRHELGRAISDAQLGGVAMSLDMKAFRKVRAECSGAATYFPPDPAIYMFRRLIITCIDSMNTEYPDDPEKKKDQAHQMLRTMPVAFVFDDHSHWQEAEEAYKSLQNDPVIGPRLGSISHADDKKVPPLQMADLCAYEARHQTMHLWGLESQRDEFTRMDAKHSWYKFQVILEEHLKIELQRANESKPGIQHVHQGDDDDPASRPQGGESGNGSGQTGAGDVCGEDGQEGTRKTT